jgi:septum site-determining protein MinD
MKTIGIISLKGGVGKTSTVVSLGHTLANTGKKVLLIDANFSAPNLGTHLDLIDPEVTLHHVLTNKNKIEDSIYNLEDFDVIPSSIFTKENFNPLRLKDKIKPLKEIYDIILIDSSPSLNDETLSCMMASDYLLVVTTPDYSTLSMTLKATKLAKQRRTPIIGLILNKVYNKNFEIPKHEIEKYSETPIMAVIPHDINIPKAQSRFTPATLLKPKSNASKEYKRLAAALVGKSEDKFKWNPLTNLMPKKEAINREVYRASYYG